MTEKSIGWNVISVRDELRASTEQRFGGNEGGLLTLSARCFFGASHADVGNTFRGFCRPQSRLKNCVPFSTDKHFHPFSSMARLKINGACFGTFRGIKAPKI